MLSYLVAIQQYSVSKLSGCDKKSMIKVGDRVKRLLVDEVLSSDLVALAQALKILAVPGRPFTQKHYNSCSLSAAITTLYLKLTASQLGAKSPTTLIDYCLCSAV